MNFTDLSFLLFFPVVAALHWLLPHRWRWALLLGASYLFYMNGIAWTGLLLLGSTAVSYLAGRQIAGAASPAKRRLWLVLGAGTPLGCLAVFKYADFFLESGAGLLRLFHGDIAHHPLNLLLPVGISFYTFQTLSYVIDVYRGALRPERHFGYYALFVSFFPQLVAGPIERPGDLLPQLKTERTLCAADLRAGLWLMLRGFFKKLLLADPLAGLADPVFAAPGEASALAVVLGTVCFALQIYCDFSGYSDIASGAARWMGIRLTKNFDHPYRAETVRDFWRRWHISLTGWLTDYIYKPLGGSRRGLGRHLRNLLLVFLISGLWHGASWHFVAWGGIHGLYLACGVLWRRFHGSGGQRLPRPLAQLRTFGLVSLAWLFFRAESLGEAGLLLSRLLFGWGNGAVSSAMALTGLTPLAVLRVGLGLVVLLLLERSSLLQEAPSAGAAAASRRALLRFLLLVTVATGWLLLLSTNGESAFLYFQF